MEKKKRIGIFGNIKSNVSEIGKKLKDKKNTYNKKRKQIINKSLNKEREKAIREDYIVRF